MDFLIVKMKDTLKEIPLDQEVFSIGSSAQDDNLVLSDPGIEPNHIKLVHTSSGWLIMPKRSEIPGTFNGTSLEKSYFRQGDILLLGKTKISLITKNTHQPEKAPSHIPPSFQKTPELDKKTNQVDNQEQNRKQDLKKVQPLITKGDHQKQQNFSGQRTAKWLISEGFGIFLFLFFLFFFIYYWNQVGQLFLLPKHKEVLQKKGKNEKEQKILPEKKKKAKEKEAWETAKVYISYLSSNDILQRMEATKLLKKHLEKNPFLVSKIKEISASTEDISVKWRIIWILKNLKKPYQKDPLQEISNLYVPISKKEAPFQHDKK